MAEKTSPLNVGAINEKIEKGEVKVKATRNVANKNTNKEHSVKGVNGRISDAQVIAWIQQQDGEFFTSTQIRDGLGFTSRTQARRVLRRLAKTGVVKIKTKQLTEKRKVYRYIA